MFALLFIISPFSLSLEPSSPLSTSFYLGIGLIALLSPLSNQLTVLQSPAGNISGLHCEGVCQPGRRVSLPQQRPGNRTNPARSLVHPQTNGTMCTRAARC
ncbi:unnamed protein product [Arctogadus glacialis]